MPFSARLATILVALTFPVLGSGVFSYVMAQTTGPQPYSNSTAPLSLMTIPWAMAKLYDAHDFTGQAGQTVTILLESKAFDAYLLLEDDQGNLIAENDDISFTNTNAALVTTLPAAGRYRVIVNTFKTEGQGLYRLTIQPTPADQPIPF